MDRLQAMATFVAVADLSGFAPAARRLRMSPSAVTRLIAALEAQLSIQLLQRTTRSVSLTDAGARYLERARRILADVAEADDAARADRTVPSGRFVVAAPSVFGRRNVAPLMCRFLSQHPAVSGELTLADRLVNLVDEGIDVAVRIGNLADSSQLARKVGATRRVVVAAPSYLAAHKRPRRPTDLGDQGHATILFSGSTPTREWRFYSGKARRESRVAITPRLVTNSADAAIAHAEAGGGLAMVLAYQVADAVRAGRLDIVLQSFEPPALPIQLVYSATRLPSASVRAFVELTLATCDWSFVTL